MKLTLTKRTGTTQGALTTNRRLGEIPGILYGKGKPNQKIIVKDRDLQEHLRSIKQGRLATQVFDIDLEGTSLRAIVKKVDYHPATYAIIHIDFLQLSEETPIEVNVPIEVVGLADCAGLKLGGSLRQVLRSVAVSCLPKDLPAVFPLDVRTLGLGESRRVSDLPLSGSVQPLIGKEELLVTIAKAKAAATA